MITSLALIPTYAIEDAYNYIIQNVTNHTAETNLFFNYVKNTWLLNNNVLFHRSIWSQFGIMHGRTNNAAEGFYYKMNRLITKNSVNIYEILNFIKTIHYENIFELTRLLGGGRNNKRKQKYVRQDELLNNVKRLFANDQISLQEFLFHLKNIIKLEI